MSGVLHSETVRSQEPSKCNVLEVQMLLLQAAARQESRGESQLDVSSQSPFSSIKPNLPNVPAYVDFADFSLVSWPFQLLRKLWKLAATRLSLFMPYVQALKHLAIHFKQQS